jgi:hypothetical protein
MQAKFKLARHGGPVGRRGRVTVRAVPGCRRRTSQADTPCGNVATGCEPPAERHSGSGWPAGGAARPRAAGRGTQAAGASGHRTGLGWQCRARGPGRAGAASALSELASEWCRQDSEDCTQAYPAYRASGRAAAP